jgi:DNA excision repair protein ERCC-2
MPYNYLFDQRLWDEDTNKVTENSVIIFDEAHNIQSTCEQIHELSISLTILAKSLQQIS